MSQHYNVKTNSWTGNKSYRVNFVGTDASGNLFTKTNTVRFGKSRPWGKTFTPFGNNVIQEKAFFKKEFKKLGYDFIDLIVENNRPIILFEQKDTEKEFLYGVETNAKFEILGNAFKISKSMRCNKENAEVAFQKSKRGERTFLTRYNCSYDSNLVFNRITLTDQNMVFYDHDVSIPLEGKIKNLSVVSKNTDVFFAFDHGSDSYLYVSDSYGDTEKLTIPTKNKSFEASDLQVSLINEELIVSGQIRGVMSKLFNGIFIAKIDPKKRRVYSINLFYYELSFLEKFWDEVPIKRIGDEGVVKDNEMKFNIVDRINLDDGSIVYFIQKHYWQRVRLRQDYGAEFKTFYSNEYHYFTDLIVTNLAPTGEPRWVVNLPMFQLFKEHNPGKNFVASQKDGKIYILHAARKDLAEIINSNDDYIITDKLDKRKTEYIALTKIEEDGSIYSENIINRKEYGGTFHPEKVGVDNVNKNFVLFNSKRRMILPNQLIINSISF